MTAITFGSPQARAIAEETRKLEHKAEAAPVTDNDKLAELLKERADLEDEIADLEEQQDMARFRLTEIADEIRHLEAGGQDWQARLAAWNAWAQGKQQEEGR